MSSEQVEGFSVPSRMRDKLRTDPSFDSLVTEILKGISPLVNEGMPFFPAFTDHGPLHISRVLATSELLIPERGWDALTSKDIGVYILASVFHDVGMHVTPKLFRNLINHESSPVCDKLDKSTWRELWIEYLHEARRWSSEKRHSVLGVFDFEHQGAHVSVFDDAELGNLNELDHLLIGEFIRRHHPRIAHECAINGAPSDSLPAWSERFRDYAELLDITGLVARSHGLPLRLAANQLDSDHGSRRETYGVHPIYLMSLLRIADFLDMHAERAAAGVLAVKTVRSTVSEKEWEAHQSIRDIRFNIADDPELVDIIARPDTLGNLEKVRDWIAGLQNELDQVWAVLGEVFGNHSKLQHLGLSLRRVRSSVDDPDAYVERENLTFLPHAASFELGKAELLPLLVSPLYGDRPEVGIRELMQNAVDACRERAVLRRYEEVDRLKLEVNGHCTTCDVIVRLVRRGSAGPDGFDTPAHWSHWLEVIDCGVGMTPEIVRNYFLRVGASFRSSEEWKSAFVDDNNIPLISRIGTFGIGALAGFLLGDEIRIRTKHCGLSDEHYGLEFDTRLDQASIELRRIAANTGTRVQVRLTESKFRELKSKVTKWDWYSCRTPSVVRVVVEGSNSDILDGRSISPDVRDYDNLRWCSSSCSGYRGVLWSSDLAQQRESCPITHNGISIGRRADEKQDDYEWSSFLSADQYPFITPPLHVFDGAAQLPLTLTRDRVNAEHLPFGNEVLRDIYRDYFAFVLCMVPEFLLSDIDQMWRNEEWYPLYRPNRRKFAQALPVFFSSAGWGLAFGRFLARTAEEIYIVNSGPRTESQSRKLLARIEQSHSSWIISADTMFSLSAGLVDRGILSGMYIKGCMAIYSEESNRRFEHLLRQGDKRDADVERLGRRRNCFRVHREHRQKEGRKNRWSIRILSKDQRLDDGLSDQFLNEVSNAVPDLFGKNSCKISWLSRLSISSVDEPTPWIFEQIWFDELRLPAVLSFEREKLGDQCSYAYAALTPYIRRQIQYAADHHGKDVADRIARRVRPQ